MTRNYINSYISFFLIVLLILLMHIVDAQNNLIPNPGFEFANDGQFPGVGQFSENCEYFYPGNFDDDIAWWKVAAHNNGKGEKNPDWVDISKSDCHTYMYNSICPSHITPFDAPSNRFVIIRAERYEKMSASSDFWHEAIYVPLTVQPLEAGANYIIRMKLLPFGEDYVSINHLRVHFTKFGEHWNDTFQNQKFEATNANVISSYTLNCNWQYVERRFTVPSDKDQLKNMVLYCETGAFAIDDVELFKECPGEMLIQNKEYNFFYNSYYGEGFPLGNNASSSIKAGFDVGADGATGDVIIKVGPQITFAAGSEITLNPGFNTESGASFQAIIASCPSSYKMDPTEENTINSGSQEVIVKPKENPIISQEKPLQEKPSDIFALSLYPNPNNGSMQLDYTLPENEPGLFEVFDLSGKKMLSYQLKGGKNSLTISNADLGNGIYLYQLLSNNRVIAKDKLVIIK